MHIARHLTPLIAVLVIAVAGVSIKATSAPTPASVPSSVYLDEPRADLTPGAVRTTDINVIANTRTGTIRNVPQSEKDAVYREYGINPRHHEPCEIDHLISLELGGSNDIKNLWAEHYSEPNGAHSKDRLETHLHALIVAGAVTVPEAQRAIATDWIAAYKKYMPVSTTRP